MLFLTECDMTFGRGIGADHPGDYKGALKLSLLPGSLLALHVIAEAQKHGGYCAFIDAEHALDKTLADTIGVNTENLREKSALESSSPALTSVNKPVSNISTTARIPSPSMNGRKQGKAKSSSSSTLDNAKVENDGLTKKVKRKPEHDLGGAHFGPEKKHQLGSLQGEARPKSKSLKQSTSIPTKSKLQPTSILV